MSEEQGQAETQPALPESMNQMEAVNHIAAALEQQDTPRDESGKFAPKTPKEDAPAEAPAEAAAEETPAEEAPAEEPAPPRKLKLKYKGEEREVDEEEAVSLAQQGYDYTQKSQALAKEREELAAKVKAEVEQREAQYLQKLETHRKALEKLVGIDDTDLVKIAQEKGPAVAQEEMFKRLQYHQTLQQIEAEQQKLTQQKSQEMQAQLKKQAEAAVETLQAKIPGWGNDLYGKVLKTAVKEFGFQQQEVNAITDHRAIEVLHDAMKWRELQAAKPKTVDKRVAVVPKVTKPGTTEKTDPKANRVQERLANLQKTGTREAGVSYFEELLEQKRI